MKAQKYKSQCKKGFYDEQLGGNIKKEKTNISEHSGYYALFTDLDGNTIGLWSKN